ncbi:hypothetical protein FQN55_005196 [Onygenales sp. PD_40]|nr:hypothetical protein FQN55_005196 [Onygenales sp. PD_40]
MFKKWVILSEFKRLPEESQYHDDEAEEELLGKRAHRFNPPSSTGYKHLLSGVVGALIGISITVTYFLWFSPSCLYGKNSALKQTSYWSPVLDDIEIPTYTAEMNGTFYPPPNPDLGRQEPSPENDEAWEFYEKIRTHVISREDIIRLGKDPDATARFEDEYWGFGPNAYMAQLDVMHQIHCLNLLRKAAFATYPGYEPSGMDEPDSKKWWIHASHCVDMLLQNIKCNANTDLITLAWVGRTRKLWPNFNVRHKCRDFEAISKWNQDNAVSLDKFRHMPLPKDAYIWPEPWKASGFELDKPLGNHTWKDGNKCLGSD